MTRILIIEDETSVRQNLLELLEAEDFDAISAENGSIGIQLAQSQIPDLIICDVMMPEIDGHGVLTALRQNPLTATTPFIFLTAKSDKVDFRQGMELGADDYLTKPFTRAEILAAITTRLTKKAAINQESQKQLEELRSSITLSLPHELRTPLNGILGFSQLLMSEANILEPVEVRDMAEGIYKSAERLNRLIQNFLLYAELELIATDAERLKMMRSRQTKFPTSTITQTITEQAKKVSRQGDLEFDWHSCTVEISESRLKKIIEELIDNALKFSLVGTPIYVKNTFINDTFTLTVIDQGRGITEKQIAEIGAYRQFERKLYEQQGSGLGLTIVKLMVQLHGGELKIESQPEEKTTVNVILPQVMANNSFIADSGLQNKGHR